MEEFPQQVSDWTFDTIVAIVQKYEYEPEYVDYKEVLNPTRAESSEHNANIRRTACSLANADGGFILFGVLDRSKEVSSPEERIVGIPLKDDLRKNFAEKLSPIQRTVYFEASPKAILMPSDPNRGIFVVYIPQSQLRPHMDEPRGIFFRRGEGGTAEIMKFYDVQEQMMYTQERLRKLALFRLELAQHRKTANQLIDKGDTVITNLLRFDTSSFKIMLADICTFFPPSSELLEKLLEIPIYASLINKRLDQNQVPFLMYQESVDKRALPILDNLNYFYNLCLSCEQKMEELFSKI